MTERSPAPRQQVIDWIVNWTMLYDVALSIEARDVLFAKLSAPLSERGTSVASKDDLLRAAEQTERVIDDLLLTRKEEAEGIMVFANSDDTMHEDCINRLRALASRLRAAAPLADELSTARRELAQARDGVLEDLLRLLAERTNKYMNTIEDYYLHGLWMARDIVLSLKSPAQGETPAELERKP